VNIPADRPRKPDALKSPPGLSDPAGAVVTWLEIGQIQGVWTSVTSAHFGEHSMLQIRAFSGVENSIFGIGSRGRRGGSGASTRRGALKNFSTPPPRRQNF
jgi:hypothetical protein